MRFHKYKKLRNLVPDAQKLRSIYYCPEKYSPIYANPYYRQLHDTCQEQIYEVLTVQAKVSLSILLFAKQMMCLPALHHLLHLNRWYVLSDYIIYFAPEEGMFSCISYLITKKERSNLRYSSLCLIPESKSGLRLQIYYIATPKSSLRTFLFLLPQKN